MREYSIYLIEIAAGVAPERELNGYGRIDDGRCEIPGRKTVDSYEFSVVSSFSPRYTRAIPRTIRRIGKMPLSSAKNISPMRLLR